MSEEGLKWSLPESFMNLPKDRKRYFKILTFFKINLQIWWLRLHRTLHHVYIEKYLQYN